MGLETAELQIVHYNFPAIAHATDRFAYNFSAYSGIEGTKNWEQVWYDALRSFARGEGIDFTWVARGVDINLSLADDPQPKRVDDRIIYATPEPKIVFYEKPLTVSPTMRTYVGKTIREIAEEMQEVYHLRLEENPLKIVFPNEEYAKSIERYQVPLLAA